MKIPNILAAQQEWDSAKTLFRLLAQRQGIPTDISESEYQMPTESLLLNFAASIGRCATETDMDNCTLHNPDGARAFLTTAARLNGDQKILGGVLASIYGAHPQVPPEVLALSLPETVYGLGALVVAVGYFDLKRKAQL